MQPRRSKKRQDSGSLAVKCTTTTTTMTTVVVVVVVVAPVEMEEQHAAVEAVEAAAAGRPWRRQRAAARSAARASEAAPGRPGAGRSAQARRVGRFPSPVLCFGDLIRLRIMKLLVALLVLPPPEQSRDFRPVQHHGRRHRALRSGGSADSGGVSKIRRARKARASRGDDSHGPFSTTP